MWRPIRTRTAAKLRIYPAAVACIGWCEGRGVTTTPLPPSPATFPFTLRRRLGVYTRAATEDGEVHSVKATLPAVREALGTDVRVEGVHGRMKAPAQRAVLDAFRSGDIDVLVATVLIEVGLDVPAATFVVVPDPSRFGLATLHQIRGRVGRGSRPGRRVERGDPDLPDLGGPGLLILPWRIMMYARLGPYCGVARSPIKGGVMQLSKCRRSLDR